MAKSFARIFFLAMWDCRSVCDRTGRGEDELKLIWGLILSEAKVTPNFTPLPSVMLQILQDGGLAAHVQKHGDLQLDT